MPSEITKAFLSAFLEYDTVKVVHIKSKKAGIINRITQLVIIVYIIGVAIIYMKGYQTFSSIESSTTTKVKGAAYTNFSTKEFNPHLRNIEDYRRIWDVADYVVPPSESGSFFVTTNIVITSNQTQSTCPEDPEIPGAVCDPNNNTCQAGTPTLLGNGMMTGACVTSDINSKTNVCEIYAWCPVEQDLNPLMRNILDTSNKTYLRGCHYHPRTNPACPIFVLGEIVAEAGEDYDAMATKGGVIAIIIEWDCNFDYDENYCIPKYSFRRLDDPKAKLAKGWNFRFANYFSDNTRSLYKVYGIKYVVIVHGKGGKFNFVPLLINIGSGLGLLAVATVIGDIIVLYVLKKRKYYRSKKFQLAFVEDEEGSCKDKTDLAVRKRKNENCNSDCPETFKLNESQQTK
ncbi:P2X purinoceptor 4-like isoform X2 [Limulus polyphemus]|uniref:P2X purinoceptor 4-like isoform X2 n=1 Tax=Limulus polyphemus TaxID=6850 RepID=A0ABM1SD22_LIMPO|nr:P2X purinoceptor 4-like isoform X2 [Limulus polyphemus]